MLPLRFRLISIAIVVLGTLLASTSAYGDTIFLATLTNGQENPPTVPTLSARRRCVRGRPLLVSQHFC